MMRWHWVLMMALLAGPASAEHESNDSTTLGSDKTTDRLDTIYHVGSGEFGYRSRPFGDADVGTSPFGNIPGQGTIPAGRYQNPVAPGYRVIYNGGVNIPAHMPLPDYPSSPSR
jgi:hypothetical protein